MPCTAGQVGNAWESQRTGGNAPSIHGHTMSLRALEAQLSSSVRNGPYEQALVTTLPPALAFLVVRTAGLGEPLLEEQFAQVNGLSFIVLYL
eukprot:365032-Chlamydomonas_euryale.AAC.6